MIVFVQAGTLWGRSRLSPTEIVLRCTTSICVFVVFVRFVAGVRHPQRAAGVDPERGTSPTSIVA